MKKYKAIGKIGEGTFSEVIKMQNLKDGSYYACKQMKQHFESIEQVNNLREIQALRRLNPHPNILTLHEVVFDRKTGSLALICELMDMNIYELIRGRRCPLPEQKIMNYMYQLCKSLDHMHRNGIFHRDVKPENILIKQDLLKLGDFGSCRSVYSKQPYTEYISTRWYRAPECLLTDGYYSYKMDMWSAGCVFYEVMRSRAMSFDFPFKKGSGISLMTSTLSPQCLSLIYAMVEYDPDERISAHQALQHSYFREQRVSEKQALVACRKVGLTEHLGEAESLKNVWQISKEGKKYLKQVEDHSERQGSTCPMEPPRLKVSGVTKLSSYSSPTLRAVLSGSGTSGKVPILKPLKYIGTNKKTDTQKDIKSNMKQYHLPTIERKSGGY
uniref:MAPK/MAK/MRK overlapping kinase isoform X3 n=1 Tax=Phascolarctos cinereus TaxID=38626 RepID=A0A6P5IXK5_PHACI|nr:MAPK/MAK/MRK overlapping kinase isoform X3 [Phascolarctos cinereus]